MKQYAEGVAFKAVSIFRVGFDNLIIDLTRGILILFI